MKKSLSMYQNDNRVIQISAFRVFQLSKLNSNRVVVFFGINSAWVGATWKRAWNIIDFECKDYVNLKKNKVLAHKFNCNGRYNYSKMFFKQMEKSKISS